MKKYIFLFFTALLFIACSSVEKNDQNKPSVKSINQQEAEKLISEGIQLLDVRTAGEVKQGKIDGAKNIDFYADDFENQVSQLDKLKPILVYCKSGGRSSNAAKKMKAQGFVEVYNLIGGYSGWEK